jgi:hypothetical protein
MGQPHGVEHQGRGLVARIVRAVAVEETRALQAPLHGGNEFPGIGAGGTVE